MSGTETTVLLKSRPEPDARLGSLIKTYLGKTWSELCTSDYSRILSMFVHSKSPTARKAASLTAAALLKHLETQTGCTIGTMTIGWTSSHLYVDFFASGAFSHASQKQDVIKVVFSRGAE